MKCLPFLWLLLSLLAGCTISRTQTNRDIEQLDTAWIVPGVTTATEVIERLGFPPPVGRADDAPAYISSNSLHWLSTDTRLYKLSLGYIITPIFEWSRTVARHDILIRFDENDRVIQLSRVQRHGDEVKILEFREVAP